MDYWRLNAEQAGITLLRIDSDIKSRITPIIESFLKGGRMLPPAKLRTDVLESILSVVSSRSAKTVVVENEYVDADYLETFARHYSKAFQQRAAKCLRLHFFSEALDLSQLFALSPAAKKSYLGYCVLRPTGNQFISRTVLCPPHEPHHDTKFIPASAQFTSHLLGQKLNISGAPFIQQDANTFICAGAAMWVVAYFMHRQHKTPRYFPAEITEFAREGYSHGHVRKGLTIQQIAMTLQKMNLNPFVETFKNLQELRNSNPGAHRAICARLRDIIHIFVDSGLPPIVAYSRGSTGHAVAVVGHDIVKRDLALVEQMPKGFLYNSHFVDTFFVMDDARGPYVPLRIEDGDHALADCDEITVIAPTPEGVTLSYGDVRKDVMQFIRFWNKLVGTTNSTSDLKAPINDFLLIPRPEAPLVLRTALLDSRSWKLQVLESKLPEWLKERYQSLLLPQFIWSIELSDFEHINCEKRSQRMIFGEVVLDATANPHWQFDGWITAHAHGLLLDASRQGRPKAISGGSSKGLYPPVLRAI